MGDADARRTRECSVDGCSHRLDIDPAGKCACHSWNRTYEQLRGDACANERRTDDPAGRALSVVEALAALREAGWTVREDTTVGQLLGDTGIVGCTYGDPSATTYVRTVAQQPWVG